MARIEREDDGNVLVLGACHQCFQVTGFYLLVRHNLFHRGQLEYGTKNGRERPVTPQDTVVENEILQLSALDRHHNCPMNAVERRNDPCGARFKSKTFGLARADTETASQADVFIEFGKLLFRVLRVVGRNQRHGFDRAGFGAFATSVTVFGHNLGKEVRRVDGMEICEPSLRDHGLAAATAAVADKVDPLPDVFAKLHEVVFIRLLEQIETFWNINFACVTVFAQ